MGLKMFCVHERKLHEENTQCTVKRWTGNLAISPRNELSAKSKMLAVNACTTRYCAKNLQISIKHDNKAAKLDHVEHYVLALSS